MFFSVQSTKGLILKIIAEQQPVKFVDVFQHLNEQYKKEISRQAVHKHLGQLVEAGVIKKKALEYSLSQAWLKETKNCNRLVLCSDS